MEEQHVIQEQPYHVTLSRGQKGTYAWDISYRGKTREETLQEIAALDQGLKSTYPHAAVPMEAILQ